MQDLNPAFEQIFYKTRFIANAFGVQIFLVYIHNSAKGPAVIRYAEDLCIKNRCRFALSGILCCVAAIFSQNVIAAATSYPLYLGAGWNLVGNSLNTNLDVQQMFGNRTNVKTVWKWDTKSGRWAFYASDLYSAGTLVTYTSNNGYIALTTINPGEGFWVNTSAPEYIDSQSGSGFSLAASNILHGWNLSATTDDVSPAAFSSTIGRVTTLWAWDNATAGWYFYSPSLANNGALGTYITNHGYRDFGSLTLGKGRGFWINNNPILPVGTMVWSSPESLWNTASWQ